MSNVTLSVVVPSIDIIFDDDTAAILTAVDADTVLGVTPGSIGLQILAATTGDGVLSTIGGVSPIGAGSIAGAAVGAHALGTDPHQIYIKKTDVVSNPSATIDPGKAAVAAHAMQVNPHRQYMQAADIPSLLDATGQARAVLSSHAMAVNPHPQYATIDQMIIADSDATGLIMAHASSRAAHPDRPTLDQSILFSSFFGA